MLRDQAEQSRHDAIRAEQALHQANAELEQRVTERTTDLLQAHDELRHQMAEQQRMREALLQREKLAALGTLLAHVAHELNNPLAVAAMPLDHLHETWGVGPWTADIDMEILQEAVDRCSNVVQSFLALARQQPPTRKAVELNMVIHDALVLLQHVLEVDGITVQLHLGEELPQLWGDAHQLQHVVVNLLTNAQHALRSTSSPRHLRLTTSAKVERNQVILEVADTGPGIPEEIQRRLFEPFFTTKPQGEGSGLGLSLCRSIVEGHGGTIHMASQSGQGTTVCMTLPVTVPDVQSPEAAPEPAATAPAECASILLIDDEAAMHRALAPLLRRSGHDITSAANGQEGLAALDTRSYEVILCDMRMPDLDGPGFYRELERRQPHLLPRVVFLTGDVLSAKAQAFFAQVDNRRLEKPFKAEAVRRVIQQVLKTQ
jgi:two-component system NtrC family sensor kinase